MTYSIRNTLWVAIFAASVMANMFFIGMMAGHGFHHGPMMPPPGGPGSPIERMHDAARDLSDADKAVVEAVFQKYDASARTHMEDVHKAFEHLNTVLTAVDYKPENLIEAHKRLAKADEITKNDIEAAMLDVAGHLSPEGRVRFFDNMLPPGGKHFGHPPTDHERPPVE